MNIITQLLLTDYNGVWCLLSNTEATIYMLFSFKKALHACLRYNCIFPFKYQYSWILHSLLQIFHCGFDRKDVVNLQSMNFYSNHIQTRCDIPKKYYIYCIAQDDIVGSVGRAVLDELTIMSL